MYQYSSDVIPAPSSSSGLHIAIIPDGNRRWARSRAWYPWQGHEKAIKNFRTITDWCQADPRIAVVTVWCFSTENWKRDPQEITKLMKLLENYLEKERPTFQKKEIRLLHSGRKDRIPASLSSLIQTIEEETKHFSDFTLHIALDYGGKDEILRACYRSQQANPSTSLRAGKPTTEQANNRTSQPAHTHDQDFLRAFLDHPELPDIDLIIRTSGEQRTSNFFLWQSTYAEWVFLDTFFPDFTTDDLKNAVDGFAKRSRRFGG
ncbi:MAG: polyprenyl diphosphate synthase [Candidatus Peribacteraceae bacterium]|nr:polyprenyl diphosphate synthase [Candidatus Peribacteraceae bacterium]MDD5739167.1 polyprenyl diphosphate synthase [Candidatus Peribacteraceae bacterium]